MTFKKRELLLLLCLLLYQLRLPGQIDLTIGYRRATAEINSEVPVVVEKPGRIGFSTAELSKLYPSYRIPVETIRIYYPDLSNAIDTVGIIWYLRPESYSRQGEVNIILVAIGSDSSMTYYVDNNNDRIFADNEEKFRFSPDVEKRVLEIKILGNYYNYTLMNPGYAGNVSSGRRVREYTEKWREASHRLSVSADFSIITGGGSAKLTFEPPEGIINKYSYMANIFGCFKPTAELSISWYNIYISPFVAIERDQYDETVLYTYTDNGRTRNYDRGTWPISKIHTGVSAGYDIRIGSFYFSPLVAYSTHKVLNKDKFDRAMPADPGAGYKDCYVKEAGIKLKMPVSEKTLLYIKYIYSLTWFDASEFLPPYIEDSYSVNYRQNYFGIGVQHRLLSL